MICCKTSSIEVCFNEADGYIEKLDYKGKNYAFSHISVFEIALRNINGKQERLPADGFLLKESKSHENGFECVYENDILDVFVKAEIKDGIDWGISITNKGWQLLPFNF